MLKSGLCFFWKKLTMKLIPVTLFQKEVFALTNDQNLQEEDFSPDTLKKKSVFSKIIDEIDHNIYITNAETD